MSQGPDPSGLKVSDYDYDLPPDRVARYPASQRDQSRLLVVHRDDQPLRHLRFSDLKALFQPGDLMVLNESRVLPVRLLGRKPTGAQAEILLLRPAASGQESGAVPAGSATAAPPVGSERPATSPPPGPDEKIWRALVRPGGKLKPGRMVEVGPGLAVEILDSDGEGGRVVRLVTDLPVEEALQRHGHMPLPPYLDREDEVLDRERYQTVYARDPGSVAAPTAGLHFTDGLLDEIALRGVELVKITLHVGVGTFRPVEVEDPADHTMHREWFDVSPAAADAVARCRARGGQVWAVGTTVVRTLESCFGLHGRIRPGTGETDLFIRPPFEFRVVDRLITNFHLPRSTLLMLVSAFAGYHRIRRAYEAAVREGYRFYSYGDAMVIL